MAENEEEKGVGPLRDLLAQLEDLVEEAGERMTKFVEEADVKRRLSDAVDAVDDVRLEVMRRLRGEDPETTPLEEMTVRELHELASEREIPGRSSMNKAELIAALKDD